MSNTAQAMGHLPSGTGVCTTVPDMFYIPELIFDALVWCLVASTYVTPSNPQGWVMFVSVFCFVITFIWFFIFLCGGHRNSAGWAAADFAYHGLAAFFYLSSSVSLAYITLTFGPLLDLKYYRMDISAVVFSFISTLLYFIHAIFSANRWKTF
ncbi:myelin and lymphocyte protein-like [Brienomyrus brachyistius]|uniref:myelin and lymphocyte protein-like n=1 Tax=Brienomyrus brachyistius TaxID=42636 RepID=UPI0020B3B371|nr:myelin and lymphocyte protein-like [Brienomyrus brachyistius]